MNTATHAITIHPFLPSDRPAVQDGPAPHAFACPAREPHESGEPNARTVAFDITPLDAAALDLARGRLSPRQLGDAGERYAALWLEEQGWRILDRNWRSRYGELDIVALDVHGEIVFVEVKTRRSSMQGSPQEAVDRRKQANLRRAAMEWLLDDSHYVPHRGTRFDVVAIRVTPSGPQTTLVPGAF